MNPESSKQKFKEKLKHASDLFVEGIMEIAGDLF